MFIPQILLNRRFRLRDVTIEQTHGEWRANETYDTHVADEWTRLRREADHANFKIWDGTYYRAVNAQALEGAIGLVHLSLGTVSYRYIATYRALQVQHDAHELEPFHHLSTAAVISTADKWYVFGKRARNGSIDLIGGGLQQDELEVMSGGDLERNLVKEIREETGVSPASCHNIIGIGAVLSSTSNVILLSHVDVNKTRLEVERTFSDREDDEMAEVMFVQKDQLGTFLASLADYRKLVPTLLQGVG